MNVHIIRKAHETSHVRNAPAVAESAGVLGPRSGLEHASAVRTTLGISNASHSLLTTSSLGSLLFPLSSIETYEAVRPARAATSFCVTPDFALAILTARP